MVPILRPRKKRCTEMKVIGFKTRPDGKSADSHGKLSDKLCNLRQGMKEECLVHDDQVGTRNLRLGDQKLSRAADVKM